MVRSITYSKNRDRFSHIPTFFLHLLASSGEPQSASAESTDQSDGWQPSSGYPATNLQAPFPIEFSGGNPPYIAQTFICVHPCDPMRTTGS